MVDYVKVSATNIADGPRIFNSAPPAILQPGQTTDGQVDITAEELESMKAFGQFEIDVDGDGKADSKPALTGKNKAELLAIAEAEGVTVAKNGDEQVPIAEATNAQITDAITAARG